MKRFLPFLMAAALLIPAAAHATQYELAGYVYCEITGLPLPGVHIHVSNAGTGFTNDGFTDENGYYEILLEIGGGTYTATAIVDPDETVIFPAGGAFMFTTDPGELYLSKNWVIASPTCSKPEGMCWMTGGGQHTTPYFDGTVAEIGKGRHSFGGNVYPGCSEFAGDGGQWNHVDGVLKRHFQGFHIVVDRCGNVDGIPPGSESPVTPFNFIEFYGTGRLQGIKGNKEKYDLVYFWARVEDRNEPGSNGTNDGELKDRYFLHVWSDPNDRNGSTLLLVDVDGDPNTVDPIAISDGNLQLHITSCDNGTQAIGPGTGAQTGTRASQISEFWFATMPNPVTTFSQIRFGLPKDSDVSFKVYDVGGRLVRQLDSGMMHAGEHTTGWDLTDTAGRRVGSGMYFIQMKSNGMARTVRIVVP